MENALLVGAGKGAASKLIAYARQGSSFARTSVIAPLDLSDDASFRLAASGATLAIGTGTPSDGVRVLHGDGLVSPSPGPTAPDAGSQQHDAAASAMDASATEPSATDAGVSGRDDGSAQGSATNAGDHGDGGAESAAVRGADAHSTAPEKAQARSGLCGSWPAVLVARRRAGARRDLSKQVAVPSVGAQG